ncbi:MAG TPA: hypothetical protein K8V84_00985 [Nocardiopsis listeri]|uniref:hypothetical protein n=1 Tax=Nocardiopsis listeri TaxID=53440 RepID=UPI001D54EFBA|nr:hypothetical protein [Nocardiopsis listeri]HJE57079.1 hypothetical protein [Nocardiopsis listeri]
MSHSHSDRRNRGNLGSMILAGACCTGAVAYAVFVGPSMLPPQDVEATNATSPEVLSSVIEPDPEEPVLSGPVGSLRVQVTDRHHAWVRTLECTGDLDQDPAACTAMAEVAAGMAEDPTISEPTTEEEDAESEDSEEAVGHPLFAEISDGTVCTDKVYGPQQAGIEGVWEGREIDTSLTRRGSCEEARWQRLVPLTERFRTEQ